MNEILRIRPEIKIRPHCIPFLDPWDFEEVYLALQDFALKYEFHTDKEEYSFHITTGTHVQKICSFLLCESRHFPARLIQAGPDDSMGPVGRLNFIDLELSRYDNIARRWSRRKWEWGFLREELKPEIRPSIVWSKKLSW